MDNSYKERLHLQNALFSRIEHDDALVAVVYRVTQPNRDPLILKICESPNHYLREVYFLRRLAGKAPVPRIVGLVEPGSGIHGAILMECLPGEVLKVKDFTEALAYEAGSILARIHQERLGGYGDLIKPHLYHDPQTDFTMKFEEGVDECKGHLPEQLLKECRSYFDNHLHLLAFVDGPCITHRDYRPGNWMVHEGKFQGVIDWSSGRAGFAEEDFCLLEHGELFSNVGIKKAFLAGYESVRKAPDYPSVMPLLRLNKAIATIGFLVKRGTWKSHSHLYEINRRFLEDFLF